MPIALIIAVAASLAVHAMLLFIPDIDLASFSEPPPLLAELKPPPAREAPVESAPKPGPAAVAAKSRATKRKARAPAPPAPTPVRRVPESPAVVLPDASPERAGEAASGASGRLAPDAPAAVAPIAATASRLPARGVIRYRVDRGDQGFMIGQSTHDWVVVDAAYRITSVTETNGLVALFKPFRIELESRGTMTAAGLLPEHFSTRRKGRATSEQAQFDWAQMLVQVGKRPAQALDPGAQDLLSFQYQLGLLADLATGSVLPVATGKKYEHYRLEVVGDEQLETPAGIFRSLHLRVPGESTTELWLAYDRSMLPVKILHTDHEGAVYVETATSIELSQEP